jgi:hypothetical protein
MVTRSVPDTSTPMARLAAVNFESIAPGFGYFLSEPAVAMSPSGKFVITWTGESNYYGSDSDIYGQRFSADAWPVGNELEINSTTVGDQDDPAVALSDNGRFVVAWTHPRAQAEGLEGQRPVWIVPQVRTQLYNEFGARVGNEYVVRDGADSEQLFSAVAMDAAGNYRVCWTQASAGVDADNPVVDVYVQKFSATGTALEDAVRVNTTLDGYQLGRSMAMNASGEFVISWDSSEPVDPTQPVAPNAQPFYDCYLQRFSATGAKVGNETRLNTHTTNNQWGSSVAINSAGGTVATWSSYLQDGSGWGVYFARVRGIHAPVAVNDTATLDEDTSESIAVLANDSDLEGDALTITTVSAPANGTASVITANGGPQGILYTPQSELPWPRLLHLHHQRWQ